MDVNLNKVGDAIGEGVKTAGDVAQISTEKFHEKYVSKVAPQNGKFGDAAVFAAELIPGVSEYNCIRKGDWKQLAVNTALDAGMLAVGVATAGLGAGAIAGARLGTDVAVKGAAEVGENVAKEALKEGAVVGAKKLEKEVAEDSIEKTALGGIKESGDEIVRTAETIEGKRVTILPLEGSGGKWAGEPGNSLWIFDDDAIPLKENPDRKTFAEINKKHKIEGIPFIEGEPDFSKISQGTVKIENFTADRSKNYSQADITLAEKMGKTPSEIKKFRKENKLTWHERSDMRTMDLVPTQIHGITVHSGGVSEYKKLMEESGNV